MANRSTPPKLTKIATKLAQRFSSGASLCFLDDKRIAVALIGQAAKKQGGERCSIVSLADERETIIDPNLYAGSPGLLAFDPKSGRLLFALPNDLTLFDAKTGAPRTRFNTKGERNVQAACFSPDGRLACTATYAAFDLWDMAGKHGAPNDVLEHYASKMPSMKPLRSFVPDKKPAISHVSAKFSPDGSLLAMSMSSLGSSAAGILRLYDVGKERLSTTARFDDPILGLDFAPDGLSIALAFTTARIAFGERSEGQGRIDRVDLKGEIVHRGKLGDEILDVRFLSAERMATIGNSSLAVIDAQSHEVIAKCPQKAAARSAVTPKIAGVRGNLLLTVAPMAVFELR